MVGRRTAVQYDRLSYASDYVPLRHHDCKYSERLISVSWWVYRQDVLVLVEQSTGRRRLQVRKRAVIYVDVVVKRSSAAANALSRCSSRTSGWPPWLSLTPYLEDSCFVRSKHLMNEESRLYLTSS